jgi:tetratricopeptide (TPR) repeat protein
MTDRDDDPLKQLCDEATRAFREKRWDQACALLGQLLFAPGTRYKRESLLWRAFGQACSETNRLGQAIDAYGRALRLRPRDLASLRALAWCYFAQVLKRETYSDEQRTAAALAGLTRFRELAALTPEDVGVWEGLGLLANRVDELAEAADAFRAAIRIDPTRTGTWCNLGEIYVRQRNVAAALAVYERLVAMNDASATERLWRYAREQGVSLTDS